MPTIILTVLIYSGWCSQRNKTIKENQWQKCWKETEDAMKMLQCDGLPIKPRKTAPGFSEQANY